MSAKLPFDCAAWACCTCCLLANHLRRRWVFLASRGTNLSKLKLMTVSSGSKKTRLILRAVILDGTGQAVLADTLIAFYRETETGATDIWRIDATGSVQIVSPTQRAFGDKAVYDVGQGILILTGGTRLETETDRISARDSIEYWEKRNLAIARGNAIATRGENRLSADVLTAHFTKDSEGNSRVHQVDASQYSTTPRKWSNRNGACTMSRLV